MLPLYCNWYVDEEEKKILYKIFQGTSHIVVFHLCWWGWEAFLYVIIYENKQINKLINCDKLMKPSVIEKVTNWSNY